MQNPAPTKDSGEILDEDGDGNDDNYNLIGESLIKKNVKEIAKKLSTTVTDVAYFDIPDESFKTAAEMYTYLNYNPPKLLKFCEGLFKNSSPREILWALTSIIKVSQNAVKKSSRKILKNTLKVLNITQFEKIGNIAKGIGFSDLTDSSVLGLLSKTNFLRIKRLPIVYFRIKTASESD